MAVLELCVPLLFVSLFFQSLCVKNVCMYVTGRGENWFHGFGLVCS